jgi:hypothetical protein
MGFYAYWNMKQKERLYFMGKFTQLFKKVGGWQVVKDYLRARVFFFAVAQVLLNGFSKKSLEIVRQAITNKTVSRLRKKYRRFIAQFVEQTKPAEQKRSNKVWVCWLQGMENAPALVQRCYRSLQENLTDREIILLTEKNYRDYVTFPAHVQAKIDSGIITRTHMSDLLRLELLLNHGGTWIDATVFCSGGQIPEYMLDSDLFFYQILKPGADGQATVLSSWFMTACTNHPVLLLTRALLYRYWEKKNSLVDYFLLHDFFQLALEAYPEHWEKVVPMSSATPHILLLRMFEQYDPSIWKAVTQQTPFHKLSYKFTPEQAAAENTYYAKILQRD